MGNLGLEKLKETRKEFGEKAELLSRKGIYPYDYMNGIEASPPRSKADIPPYQASIRKEVETHPAKDVSTATD